MNVVVLVGIIVTIATGVPVFIQMRNHPRGLFVLFFAEMWERFSFYGMRGLLIFYLTQHFLLSDAFSGGQYGAYASLVYLMPLLGGVMADRFIGTRKAVAFGALLLVAGQLLMAAEGPPARQFVVYEGQRHEIQISGRMGTRQARLSIGDQAYAYGPAADGGLAIEGLPAGAAVPSVLPGGSYQIVEERDSFFFGIFYFALSLIIMGVGFLKPNISTIVGQLYPQGDPRRDPGFTLFYYGINLGAFWSSVLCGLLGQAVGWWAGFGLAGVGMLAGFVVFVRGKPWLEGHGEPPDPKRLAEKVIGPLGREHVIYLCAILGVGVVWLLIQRPATVGYLLAFGSVLALSYVGWHLIFKCNRIERERMLLAFVLLAGSIVFFSLFEQAGSSLNLFDDRNTNLPSNGFFTVTAAQTQSFNAGFILIFAPVLAIVWAKLGQLRLDPGPLVKFGLGLLQVGLGFLLLAASAGFADAEYRLPMLVLMFAYLLHTTGELCLSPIGLSEMTKLSVPALVATMMAIWFVSTAWGDYLAGQIAQLAGAETLGGQVLDPALALRTSLSVFSTIGWFGVASGVVFLGLSPLLKHWAHGADDATVELQTKLSPADRPAE